MSEIAVEPENYQHQEEEQQIQEENQQQQESYDQEENEATAAAEQEEEEEEEVKQIEHRIPPKVQELQQRFDDVANKIRSIKKEQKTEESSSSSSSSLENLRQEAAATAKEAMQFEQEGMPEYSLQVLSYGAKIFSCDLQVRALIYNNLACVERRRGEAEQALLHLEDAVDCEGGEDQAPPSTLLNLSAVVLGLGYFGAAVRVAQQAVKRLVGVEKQAQNEVNKSYQQELKNVFERKRNKLENQRENNQRNQIEGEEKKEENEMTSEKNKKLSAFRVQRQREQEQLQKQKQEQELQQKQQQEQERLQKQKQEQEQQQKQKQEEEQLQKQEQEQKQKQEQERLQKQKQEQEQQQKQKQEEEQLQKQNHEQEQEQQQKQSPQQEQIQATPSQQQDFLDQSSAVSSPTATRTEEDMTTTTAITPAVGSDGFLIHTRSRTLPDDNITTASSRSSSGDVPSSISSSPLVASPLNLTDKESSSVSSNTAAFDNSLNPSPKDAAAAAAASPKNVESPKNAAASPKDADSSPKNADASPKNAADSPTNNNNNVQQQQNTEKAEKIVEKEKEEKKAEEKTEQETKAVEQETKAVDQEEQKEQKEEEKKQVEEEEDTETFPPQPPPPQMPVHHLVMIATARYNLGVALRELGDIVKGRNELERANDVFIENDKFLSERKEQVPQTQVERLKNSIASALALPFHLGGTTPARVNDPSTLDEYNNNNNYLSQQQQQQQQQNDQTTTGVTSPSSSSSKFRNKFHNKIRGQQQYAGTPQPSSSLSKQQQRRKAPWDNTTGLGSSIGLSPAGRILKNVAATSSLISPSFSTALLVLDAQSQANYHDNNNNLGAGDVAVDNQQQGAATSPNRSLILSSGNNNNNYAAAGGGGGDPSVELRLAGTYVPLRLVRLTEEVRFRESCRRVALTRARNEDLHDFKLLMQRERIIALEEEQRVELEVEQDRLFGVIKYWIQFKTVLLFQASKLGDEESTCRDVVKQQHVDVCQGEIQEQAKILHFLCEQDSQRFIILQQETDSLEVIRRNFDERNAYFEAKIRLAQSQMRALACALSCWAWDCALKGENTVGLLRAEMQQSPIVSLRSLTFGPGKWR